MEAHHNEVEPQTVEAVIVQAADALSRRAARARAASRWSTTSSACASSSTSPRATRASRRSTRCRPAARSASWSRPSAIDDDGMALLSREIAREIEQELEYPGQIKVTVIRESRAVEYAK